MKGGTGLSGVKMVAMTVIWTVLLKAARSFDKEELVGPTERVLLEVLSLKPVSSILYIFDGV